MRVVYLHGFASGPGSKKASFFRERFAGCGINLEIPDLNEGGFEHLTITRQLRAVERAARGEPVVLIGSSMGGYLAALYAALHLEVPLLVLMAPAFGFIQRWEQRIGPIAWDEWRTTGRLPVHHHAFGETRELSFELIEDGLQYNDYPDFSQPALIFHGRRDDIVPFGYSQLVAERRPNVELHLVDAGHELTDVLDTMWDHTRRFLAI